MLAIILVLIAIASIQFGSSFAKTLFPLIGPLPTVMLRVTIAALIMALIFRPWRARPAREAVRPLLFYGASLGLMNCAFYLALRRIPLGITVALEFTGPLAVALFSSKKKVDWLWALSAAFGIFLILPLHIEGAKLDLVGIALALVAGVGWAFYIIFGKKVGALVEARAAASIGMIVAATVTLPFGLPTIHWASVTPHIWLIGLGIAIMASAVPYTLEMFALKKIHTTTFGILMSIEPAMAALSGLIVLSEHLSRSQWIAIFCIIVASGGSSLTSRAIDSELAT